MGRVGNCRGLSVPVWGEMALDETQRKSVSLCSCWREKTTCSPLESFTFPFSKVLSPAPVFSFWDVFLELFWFKGCVFAWLRRVVLTRSALRSTKTEDEVRMKMKWGPMRPRGARQQFTQGSKCKSERAYSSNMTHLTYFLVDIFRWCLHSWETHTHMLILEELIAFYQELS